jgi:hypothetical protein
LTVTEFFAAFPHATLSIVLFGVMKVRIFRALAVMSLTQTLR